MCGVFVRKKCQYDFWNGIALAKLLASGGNPSAESLEASDNAAQFYAEWSAMNNTALERVGPLAAALAELKAMRVTSRDPATATAKREKAEQIAAEYRGELRLIRP